MNSRKQALEILFEVFLNKQYSNVLLSKISSAKQISSVDKQFIYTLVYGTIKHKIFIEYVVNKLINPDKTPKKIQVILWMSVFQMIHLKNIPDYAIVNEAVELTKQVTPKFAGLVNGVLKRFLTEQKELLKVDIKNKQNIKPLSLSFPFWLFKKISRDYSLDVALKVAENSLQKAKIAVRVNSLKGNIDDIFKRYHEEYNFKYSEVCHDSLISERSVIDSDLFKDGEITIQDEASALVCQVLNPQPNSKILDMCSAPGGKLTHLAALTNNQAQITGCEISEKKIKLINQNIARLGVENVKIINQDASQIVGENQFDYIVLDAPCSGFGVLKRKPEIKLQSFTTEHLQNIYQTQKKLLQRAFELLKPGGEMVYSTCTINLDENQNQIKLLQENNEKAVVLEEIQIFGFEKNTDGFYICKLTKNN
ncbi:16S rRNA (cytosine(967)-C(5))-methyltransferase RsmB [Spiroplasma alleghenense]|uniref:16S rRNA (cytosine(967)-C(5))-methyltransferase n=1 Tax=Spiroplasma alleghenense TaxID=216931 RepID=A0A345Z425_9MOLU|nr:16S rRNA (cytosine(967)-C(5))-methyltransferase RsmB [Spiroplasma alleghenense]AXK51354.1 16S rRNA (cytosine967-C5)-methyltransferase [Spiroplasma alleghenense]